MFGMGFMEIFLVLIVAVMALGPEKLPSAAVDMVKFFRKIKGGIDDAKSTIDSELNLTEMKAEANKFKANFSEIKGIASLDMDDMTSIEEDDDKNHKPKKEQSTSKEVKEVKSEQIEKKEVVTDAKKSNKENISYDTKGNA